MAEVGESMLDPHSGPSSSEEIAIKRMQRRSDALGGEAAEANAARRVSSKYGPQLSRRFSGAHSQDAGWFSTAPIADGVPSTLRGLARTSSFARSVSSQATYRDPFNGSLTTSPQSYLRSYSSPPPPLPSSVASWRSALEEALTTARTPLASLPQTFAHPAKENQQRHSHVGDGSAPCFHCAEAVQARAHEQKLEAAKQAAELEARQARAEVAAGAAREAVLEGQLEVLTRRLGDAVRAAASVEKVAGEEHEAALAAAAEWRKKSLEEARKHAAELAALTDSMKEQWRQGTAAQEQTRREAESTHAAEREEWKARVSEMEKAKERAEGALRASEEQAKEAAARLLKVDEAVEIKTQEVRRQLDEMHERHRLLQGDMEALRTALDVAKQSEAGLHLQLEDAAAAVSVCQAEVESAREESHRWRRECREAQETARELTLEKEEQRRRKEERAARPFDEVQEELEAAMERALERHGVQAAAEGLSDDAYLAAMARLQAQRTQTEKQRQNALAREGVDVAALQHATSVWVGRHLGQGVVTGRARANSMPARWEHRQTTVEVPWKASGGRPQGEGPRRARGTASQGRPPGTNSSVEGSPDHAQEEVPRRRKDRRAFEGPAGEGDERFSEGQSAELVSDPARRIRASAAASDKGEAYAQARGPSMGSSLRSSPEHEEESSELADSDWGGPRPPRERTSMGGATVSGRGPLSC